MDGTDLRIFRALTHGRAFFWASLDPRLSAEKVARKLKLAPRTVRARVRAWRDGGFLARMDVVPHPALLGLRLGTGNLRIDDVRAKPGVLRDLALVPGALAALDHVGNWLAMSVVAESESGIERVRRLVAKLPGVDEVTPCRILAPPPPRATMSRLDWEILREIRATPDASLREVADRMDVSVKTLSRRYGALVDKDAALFVPVMDLRKAGGALARFILFPQANADRAALLARLRALPLLVDAFDGTRVTDAPDALLDAWVLLPTAADAEDLQRDLAATRGVDAVELLFPTRQEIYSRWLDEVVDAHVERATA